MEKVLRLYKYIDGINDIAFPNEKEQAIITSFRYDAKRMGAAPTISFSLMHSLCLDSLWNNKVYALFNGERFYVKQTPTSSYSSSDTRYKHEVELVSERFILDNIYFYDAVSSSSQDKPVSNNSKFSFFGNIEEYVSRLNNSLDKSNVGYRIVIDDDILSDKSINSIESQVSFEDQVITNALQEIYNVYKIPYYFVGKTIHVGYYQDNIDTIFKYGCDNSLISISKTNANSKVINKITGVGSSDNIPYYYPNADEKGITQVLYNGREGIAEIIDLAKYRKVKLADKFVFHETIQSLVPLIDENDYTFGDFRDEGIDGDGKQRVSIDFYYSFTLQRYESVEFSVTTTYEDSLDLRYEIFNPSGQYVAYYKEDKRLNLTGGNYQFVIRWSFLSKEPMIGSDDVIKNFVSQYLKVKSNIVVDSSNAWTKNNIPVTLSDYGISVNSPSDGDVLTIERLAYIQPQPNLVPPIYRDTEGGERFYEAINGKYKNEQGGYYQFDNEYTPTNPREHIENFDDIKPTIKNVINGSGYYIDEFIDFAYDLNDNDETDESGKFIHPYFFGKLRRFDGEFGFNLFDHAIDEGEMVVSMTSGTCGSCEFIIGVDEQSQKNIVQVDADGNLVRDNNGNVRRTGTPQDRQNDTKNNEVWIALKKDIQTFGVVMPNAGNNYRPKAKDKFVLLHIDLPQKYVEAAENALKDKLIKYMHENNFEKFNFSIAFSRIYFAENPTILANLSENSKIKVEYNKNNYELYVSSLSYSISSDSALPEVKVELEDALSISQNQITQVVESTKREIISSIDKNVSWNDIKGVPTWITSDKPRYSYSELSGRGASSLGSDEWTKMFVLNKSTGLIDVLKTFSSAVFNKIFLKEKSIIDIKRSIDSDEDVSISDETIPTTKYLKESVKDFDDKFLSKTKDDTANGVITFEKGWETKEYSSGLLGHGAKVDEAGQAELHSLFVRTFMEVPEFRKNRVTVRMGDSITSCSAGIIKSVNIIGETSGTIELKLEDGEFGSLEAADIVFQIFSDMENKENNSTETSDDGKGNRTIKGFATVMFKVTGVSGERNEIVAYSLRPINEGGNGVHPFQFGTFSQRGSFDNAKPERQIVIYEGIYPQPYTRYMFGVNDWEFTAKMIGMQLGYLGNLSVFGMDMTGYSAYLNNVYFTGMIRQLYIHEWIDGESAAQNGTLVYMGGDHYVSKGDTTNPPLFDLTDEDGNSLLFTDEEGEGNILNLNNEEYDQLAKKGEDGVGIKSNVSYYMITDTNEKPLESSSEWSLSMVQPTDLKPYLWKKNVITYSNLVKNVTIECISVRGKDGTSVSIKGSYNSEAELKAAFPNGPANASDAYIVNGDLYVWTGSGWKNVGAIKGEKGDTAYVHLKYANETSSGTQVSVGGSVYTLSFTSNDGEDVGDWLGIYTDFVQADSMNISDYKWKNIKGEKGNDSTSYWLDSPVGAINFTTDGYPSPTSFVVSMKKKTGNGNVVACSDFYLATWKYDGNWQMASISSVKTSSVTIIPAASTAYKQYRVTAHTASSASESNIVCQIGIGVSFNGAKGEEGAEGIYVYDAGFFDKNRAYYYKTIDGKVRRDKIVYEIGGSFYNFLVRSRQADDSIGLVNTPPTSTQGDTNWEVMSQYQSFIANTIFGTNANIGGFMVSAEKMISQSGMFELNGSNGTMTMHQSGGTTWSVDENGVQSVGNENGERIVIDPNSKSMSVFDTEGVERTTFDGNEYTREQLVVTNGGSFTLNANASNAGGKQLTSRGEEYETVSYPITSGLNASYVGVVQVSLSDFDASIVYEHEGATSDEILGIPSGRVSFYLNTYTGNGGTLISKKLIATKTIDGIQTLQSRLIDGVYSVSAPSGYHQVVAEMSVCNFSKKGYATLTAKWSISSVILSVESYISRHFANGMMLSKSSSEYFMAMVESGKMVVEMASNGSRHSFKDGVYSVNGIKQPVLVYAARVTDTSESSSAQPSKTELVNNGASASLTKTTTTGRYTLTLPMSYGLTGSNMMVCLTGYGTSAGETAPIKATLLSYSASASSMVLTIATSDDSSPNYGGFYIEIKKIV